MSESVQHAACPNRNIGVGLWGPKSDPAAGEKKIEELLATSGRALGAFLEGFWGRLAGRSVSEVPTQPEPCMTPVETRGRVVQVGT